MPALFLSLLLALGDDPAADAPRTAPPSLHDPTNVTRCCAEGKALPWSLYNRGVSWTDDLGEARRRALAEGKLLMVFRLVGDLDKGGT